MGGNLSQQLQDLSLDHLEIKEELGRGTFGIVNAVNFKRKDGSFVSGVGKQLTGGSVSQDMAEKIRVLFKLDHDCLARLYGLYFTPKATLPVLVTERLHLPLEDYLRLKWTDDGLDKLHILNSVSSAIVYLHSQQPSVVHGHLTSHNVLVVETINSTVIAKVTDTGLPALLQVTPQEYVKMCPSARVYLPPEALAGDVCLFPAADVFAFGVLMIRVLLHRLQLPDRPPIFKLTSGRMILVEKSPESSQIEDLLSNHPQYSLLQQCLAKSVSERPLAGEVQKALKIEQCAPKISSWHHQTRQEAKKWIDGVNSLSIMVTGRTGAGKTSLVNGLVGEKVGIEGETLNRETASVVTIQKILEGVYVTIYDTPGLQDGTSHEEEYLRDMKMKCKGADLNIYCIQMSKLRFEESDIRAIQLLTSTFGSSFWNRTVFVLTFANQVVSMLSPSDDPSKWIASKVDEWKTWIIRELQKYGVPERVTKNLVIIPAGYHSATVAALNPWKLPGIDNWFHNFWYACASQMNRRHLPALVKINMRRFKREEDITEDDLQDQPIENQPIPSYALAGGAIGAVVGGIVGYYMPGCGALAGAKVGAKYGASLIDILLEMKAYAAKAKEYAQQTLEEFIH